MEVDHGTSLDVRYLYLYVRITVQYDTDTVPYGIRIKKDAYLHLHQCCNHTKAASLEYQHVINKEMCVASVPDDIVVKMKELDLIMLPALRKLRIRPEPSLSDLSYIPCRPTKSLASPLTSSSSSFAHLLCEEILDCGDHGQDSLQIPDDLMGTTAGSFAETFDCNHISNVPTATEFCCQRDGMEDSPIKNNLAKNFLIFSPLNEYCLPSASLNSTLKDLASRAKVVAHISDHQQEHKCKSPRECKRKRLVDCSEIQTCTANAKKYGVARKLQFD
jgi:hypothetical protein